MLHNSYEKYGAQNCRAIARESCYRAPYRLQFPHKLAGGGATDTFFTQRGKGTTMTGDPTQIDRRAFLRGLALLAASLPLSELGRVLAQGPGAESEWAVLLRTLGKHEGMTVYQAEPVNTGGAIEHWSAARRRLRD